ncbi:MAG: type II toxin-antitoxin system RelE/ParE family toxin [Bacteroidales bacterium]|nr:type II toxin-antitoxin system RelE/ParE family toxin [Bacteroidales bacterium]
MNSKIVTTEDFERNFKRLSKKYHSLSDDFEILINILKENPKIGDDLGNNVRKVRMSIASKSKDKSGGARVITCSVLITTENVKIYLLTIYDKGEKDTISKKDIEFLKEINGLV